MQRLRQRARANAGIGEAAVAHDLVPLRRLILGDIPPSDSGRLRVALPSDPVMAWIDPDAFAILLSNLIGNALQHSPPGSPVQVHLRLEAVLEVVNAGRLDALTQRFARRGRVRAGPAISAQIVGQAGGRLDLLSPASGKAEGFMVRVGLRGAD